MFILIHFYVKCSHTFYIRYVFITNCIQLVLYLTFFDSFPKYNLKSKNELTNCQHIFFKYGQIFYFSEIEI